MGLSQPTHLIALFLIVLLLFGARRLPEIGRSLGVGMREFKDSVSGIGNHNEMEQQPHSLPPGQTSEIREHETA
jgi:sec-independent protein translocase protein TatA